MTCSRSFMLEGHMAGPTSKSSTGHLPPMCGRSSPVLEVRLACGVLKSQCSCFLGLIETSLHLPRTVQMLKGCSLERQKKNQYFCICDCPRQGPFNWTLAPFHFSGDQYGNLKLIFKGPVTRQEVRNSGKIAVCMPSLNVTGSHQHANRMLE